VAASGPLKNAEDTGQGYQATSNRPHAMTTLGRRPQREFSGA
jgi:hypothetical protein